MYCNATCNTIINYSCEMVHYISMTYLFYNWKFVPFDPFYPFGAHPPNLALPLATISFSLYS